MLSLWLAVAPLGGSSLITHAAGQSADLYMRVTKGGCKMFVPGQFVPAVRLAEARLDLRLFGYHRQFFGSIADPP